MMDRYTYEGRIELRDAEPGVRSEVILLLDHPDSERFDPIFLVEDVEEWLEVRHGEAPGRYRIVVEHIE